MTSIHLTRIASTLALTLAAFGAAQASEITEFPVSASPSTSRAAVKAEARKANDAGLLRYDFIGAREVLPMASTRSREQVRMEARSAARQQGGRGVAAGYYVGGM